MPGAEGGAKSRPNDETRAAEEREAAAPHTADRPPTEEESELADEIVNDPSTAEQRRTAGEHFREMAERGAAEQGEGRIP